MPGGHEGRSGTQVRFSDKLEWLCSRTLPREDLSTIPFVGDVVGETPAVPWCDREVRRRDVGPQRYGSGTPAFNGSGSYTEIATSHGNLKLSSDEPHLGFMPTAATVDFLRSEYLGSRSNPPPARFYK